MILDLQVALASGRVSVVLTARLRYYSRVAEYSVSDEGLAEFFEAISPHLDERQRRLLTGGLAEMLGHGGITAVAKVSGLARNTVQRGAQDIRAGVEVSDRTRAPGAGRKPAEVAQPGLAAAVDSLVEPESRGDPMCSLRWTTKSTRKLSEELDRLGFQASHTTVRGVLSDMGYSLQATAKTIEGAEHPDRDAQFRYIAALVGAFQGDGQPVISVDAKKKELWAGTRMPGRNGIPRVSPFMSGIMTSLIRTCRRRFLTESMTSRATRAG